MERLLGRWDSTHRSTRMRGWDFSVLEGAMVCGEPDWDFEAECRGALVALADAGGGTVLDMTPSAAPPCPSPTAACDWS